MKRILSIILIMTFLITPVSVQAHDCDTTQIYEDVMAQYLMNYDETDEQRQEIKDLLKVVASKLITEDMSDYQKLKIGAEWISSQVTYDYSYKNRTAYSSLFSETKGKVVCTGYSTLFYYWCTVVNIPCEVVIGHCGEIAPDHVLSDLYDTNHAWNIVKLGSLWYQVDLTGVDGNLDNNNKKYLIVPYYNDKGKIKTAKVEVYYDFLRGTDEYYVTHQIISRPCMYDITKYQLAEKDYNEFRAEQEILIRTY